MALYSELPVYKATYDLLLAIFRFTKDFGKEYKYTVGESLKKETIELLTLIYRANVKRDKQGVLQSPRTDRGNTLVYPFNERHAAD
jgi:hypothetical protein